MSIGTGSSCASIRSGMRGKSNGSTATIRRAPAGMCANAVDTAVFESRARRPYHAGSILYYDTDASGHRLLYMYLPTFGELGDSAFLASHCFRYGGEGSGAGGAGEDLVRVDFAPLAKIKQPDVSGSVYLDAQSLTVRRAVFQMTKPDAVHPPVVGFKVTTSFRELVPLVPLMDSVETEQPIAGEVYVRLPRKDAAPGSSGGDARRVSLEIIQRYRVLSVEFENASGRPASGPPIIPRPIQGRHNIASARCAAARPSRAATFQCWLPFSSEWPKVTRPHGWRSRFAGVGFPFFGV